MRGQLNELLEIDHAGGFQGREENYGPCRELGTWLVVLQTCEYLVCTLPMSIILTQCPFEHPQARDDPSTSLLVDALMSSEKVIVLSRDVRAQVTTAHPKIATLSSRKPCSCHCHPGEEIWLTRVRSGLTPAQRRSANWTASTRSLLPPFSPTIRILELNTLCHLISDLVGHGMALESFSRNYSPERRYGRQFEDVVDLLIFDNRSDQEPHDWHSFSEIVAKHVLQSRGCASWEELVEGQTMTGVVRHDCPGNARAIFREQD